jgi:hypothetical protein
MQPPFQSAQFQHQAMGYSQHPYGQSAPMASPQYGQNMHGYMQSQQQLWSPHQSQSPHHV